MGLKTKKGRLSATSGKTDGLKQSQRATGTEAGPVSALSMTTDKPGATGVSFCERDTEPFPSDG